MGTPLALLHVEDEQSDSELLIRLLKRADFDLDYERVEEAATMRSMLDRRPWDLVISDYNLPRFDGPAALKVLRESGQDIPFIVVSGTIGEETAVDVMRTGVTDYLMKGNLSRLVPSVQRELEQSKARKAVKVVEDALRKSEKALRETAERLQRIVSIAKVGLWDWNFITNEIHYSPECKQQLGFSEHEIGDDLNTWIARLHPDDYVRVVDFAASYVAGQRSNYSQEFRLKHKDGSYCWILTQGSVLFDEEGKPAHLLGSHIDITERKGLEEQFQQSQKMESVGRLAGGIAHDFNNLLSVILGYTDMSIESLPASSALRDDLEQIQRAGNRAAELTQQLLAFSRKQVFHAQVLNLNSVLIESEKMLRRVISENIELVYLPSSSLGNVNADPGQIEQVIMNLVVNARDAMPTGGKVILETRDVIANVANFEQYPAPMPGAYVALMISDTGTGMDPSTIRQVFEPFFTTKEMGKGTGLGLSTVYGIINQSGGSIHIRSQIGIGTTFTILLPRVEDAVPLAMPSQLDSTAQGSGVIVLVEDDDALRDLTNRMLTRAGYTVVAASGGVEALAICETEERPVRLLVTDVVMPRMSGPELVERLKSRGKHMNTLFISGYSDDAVIRETTVAANFLSKPFTSVELTQKVAELLKANTPVPALDTSRVESQPPNERNKRLHMNSTRLKQITIEKDFPRATNETPEAW